MIRMSSSPPSSRWRMHHQQRHDSGGHSHCLPALLARLGVVRNADGMRIVKDVCFLALTNCPNCNSLVFITLEQYPGGCRGSRDVRVKVLPEVPGGIRACSAFCFLGQPEQMRGKADSIFCGRLALLAITAKNVESHNAFLGTQNHAVD